MRTAHTGREIRSVVDLPVSVLVDPARIAQMLSNLLGNAITYGCTDRPVTVRASVEDGRFVLAVVNHGNRIPPHIIPKIFAPFNRGESETFAQGLGLGLYISFRDGPWRHAYRDQ